MNSKKNYIDFEFEINCDRIIPLGWGYLSGKVPRLL